MKLYMYTYSQLTRTSVFAVVNTVRSYVVAANLTFCSLLVKAVLVIRVFFLQSVHDYFLSPMFILDKTILLVLMCETNGQSVR